MDIVNVKIDVSTPKGRKLVRELYEQKGVEIENPIQPEVTGTLYEVDDVFDRLLDKLKNHYGVEK